MRRILRTIICFALALNLALCAGPACLAEDQEDASPVSLPEPQDLAALFPDDEIVTKDFGGFTISYPDSMKFEETATENDNEQTIALTDMSGKSIVKIMRTDLSAIDIEDSTSAFDYYGVMFLVALTGYTVGLAEEAESRGEDFQYSVDPAMVSLSGRSALSVLVHTEHATPEGSTVRDELCLLAPLGEKEVLLFIVELAPDLSGRVVLSSILNTVEWKE